MATPESTSAAVDTHDDERPATLMAAVRDDGTAHSATTVTPRQIAIGDAGRVWMAALMGLFRLADWVTELDDLSFLWGELGGDLTLESLKDHARGIGHAIAYLDFAGPVEDGPTNLILVDVAKGGITVSENCELWAIPRSNEVEILTPGHRFHLDDDCRLRRKPNRLDAMRARRVTMAHDRWRALATERAKAKPGGWKFVSVSPPPARSATAGAVPAPLGAVPVASPRRDSPCDDAAFPLRSTVMRSDVETAAAAAVARDPERHEARLQALKPTWQAWSTALNDLMRHPKAEREGDELLICGGYAPGEERRQKLLALSRQHRRSLIYLRLDEPLDRGPLEVTVVLHSHKYDRVLYGCEAIATDESAPIQLLSGSHRVVTGRDGRLSLRRSLVHQPVPALRTRAWERWRTAAMARQTLENPDTGSQADRPAGE